MLKIRLQRVGRKNDASFRVVVIESQRGPKAGDALEVLGFYDPKKNVIEIKGDRATHWISVGAQVSDTVHNLLIKQKIIKGEKINVLPKKSPIKKEEASDEKGEGKVSEEPKQETEQKTETKEEKVDDKEEVKEKPKEEAKKEEKKQEETKEEKTEETKPADAKGSGEAKKEDEKKS